MLQPLANNPRRARSAVSASVPAPVSGWNARDSLANMAPDHAVRLDNVFPDLNEVTLRQGFATHATELGGSRVETLMAYSGPSSAAFFAAAGGTIYDVTAPGPGTSAVTGLSGNRWQHAMVTTSGGSFLWACNGVDAPRHFNGTTWATPTLSGVTATDIFHVVSHQSRLFVLLNDSLDIGYLGLDAISGAVSTFPLGPVFSKGGRIVTAGTWTRDGGSGPDDLIAFFTSEGEVAIYAGTNPASDATWGLVGVFALGAPLGARAAFKQGAELIVITQDGYVPLSAVLPGGRVNNRRKSISDQIQNVVVARTRAGKTFFGWQAILYPQGSYILFNVPLTASTFEQHVFNTQTGAPCRFTGQHAVCWGLLGDDLYFGTTDGAVMKADTGRSDNGAEIVARVKPAFNYFGRRGQKKLFSLMRPALQVSGNIRIQFSFDTDFQAFEPADAGLETAGDEAVWDTALWDVATWGRDARRELPWLTVNAEGIAGAPDIRIATARHQFSLAAFDVVYQPGEFF